MIYERDFMKHTMLEHDAVFKNQQVHELHRLYRVQRNLVDEVKGSNSNGEGSTSQACNGPLQSRRKMIDLELPADEFDETDEITTCIPSKRPRSGREDGSHRSNSSGSCLDVKNSNGLADLNEPLNWQDAEPVAALSRDVYSHYGRNSSQNGGMVLGAGHDRSTQRDLHLPSHSVQVRSNSAVQPQSYLTTDHSNVVFSRERAYRELEVRSKNPQASYDSYVESFPASNAPRLHNDYRPDFVRPWSHWSSSWENPRSTSHQRFFPVQTNPYMNFVARTRTDTSFDTRSPVTNGVYHGFSSGSKEAAVSFPSGGFRPNASLGEVVKHQSSESFQGLKTQESSAMLPWLKPKPSYKSERSSGLFDLNASTDQFMDGTDAGDGRNGVSLQTGFRSSASCSYNANMGRIELINPQNSGKNIGGPVFQKHSICKEEHAPFISHSLCVADQHKEVKRDFDINLPCDASVSVDQRGSKAFCAVKEEGNKAAINRHYFDLNSCASEDDEDSGLRSSLRVKTKGNMWIDLEAPPALESEEEGGGGSQDMKGQDDNALDELIKEAAQAIVAISLSDHHRHPDDAASSTTDAALKSPLSWLADMITSCGDELERKADKSPEATDFEGYREEYSSGEIDYFEAMTLNLHPTKEEDYMPEPLVPKNLILEGTGLNRLRRGQARRGRPKRDFQRDTLPGLSSLSRQEVTEDIQLFGGLMKSREHTWSSGVASRRNSKRKRTVTNVSQAQVCPSMTQPESVSVVGLEDGEITGWGKATRRPRRQRCPPAGNPATVIFT
ncbi:uncharacterized protein LOC103840628 isoform X1 [Brassica rapa]|uniref:Uncharacterized protein n=1 Tax=Brassica campestris TaxID=3711 RepID=M4E7E8_BRACM|nr:uncharacterized protein LOC103840628 isoform X1 [Brassica rapa]XP_009115382.1 uncharacterized protein LOC103840628 isoform X1 [Brassica rapa]